MSERESGGRLLEWNSIPEEAPNSADLAMLDKIENNPDCREFLSYDEAMKELGI